MYVFSLISLFLFLGLVKFLKWFGIAEETIRSDLIYTEKDIHLDDQNPPVDIIYLKYDRVEKLFGDVAWRTIKEHGMLNFYMEQISISC